MTRIIAAIMLLGLAGGCAGQRFDHLESSYQISDDARERLITVAPAPSRRIWRTRGGTTGKESDVMETYRRAGERYLAEKGRVCTVENGRPGGGGWVFPYRC